MNAVIAIENFIDKSGKIMTNSDKTKSSKAIIYQDTHFISQQKQQDYTILSTINNGIIANNTTVLIDGNFYKIKSFSIKYICDIPIYIKAFAKKEGYNEFI